MGAISQEQTHDPRSSSLSRIILVLVLFSIALFIVLLQGTTMKQISIVLNGEEIIVDTKQTKLQALLDEQAISLQDHDYVSQPLTAKIKHGDSIIIDHAVPVHVIVDGHTNTHYTTGDTVGAVIREMNIMLGREDRIIPAIHTEISADQSFEIVRVETIFEEQEKTLPFEMVTEKDNTLVKGKMKVVQEGLEGTAVTTIKKVLENGVIVSEEVVGETVKQNSVSEIVTVGTKNPVVILSASSPNVDEKKVDGVTFGVKQVLDNVTVTAYDAGINSTGKTEEHPQYGITFTGTTVKEGHTAAVDPNVIPLGWWFYIEGIGLRRAEDIGSAIKGKSVDIYMESEDKANQFGRQRGHTIYIVGPDKPY